MRQKETQKFFVHAPKTDDGSTEVTSPVLPHAGAFVTCKKRPSNSKYGHPTDKKRPLSIFPAGNISVIVGVYTQGRGCLLVSSSRSHEKERRAMPHDDQLRPSPFPDEVPQKGLAGVEASNSSALISRQKVLKLAGAVTLGAALGLTGSQEAAHARKKKKRRPAAPPVQKAAILGATVTEPGSVTGSAGIDNRLAQTFTNPIPGVLSQVQVILHRIVAGPGGNFVFSINQVNPSGVPTNTVLGSTTILDSALPSGTDVVVSVVGLAVPVSPGQKYALVIYRPNLNVAVRYHSTNTYSGGELYISNTPTGTFSLIANSSFDMVFSTFITPS